MASSQNTPGQLVVSDPAFWIDTVDLTSPDDFTDVIIVVEGRNLYTSKGILASASPVWRRMFVSDFKERDAEKIPLPGKKFDDVLELLMCISPAIQRPVTGDNVLTILPLADEYQMYKLKQDCELWLMHQLSVLPSGEQQMAYLSIAEKYSLDRLLENTVTLVSDMTVEDLERNPDYENLEQDTVVRILKRRVQSLETGNRKLQQSTDSWRQKCEDLQDCLMKMSREKLVIKRYLDEVEGSWELKGSDARCIDPVHIYGPRNYACEKCSRQVHTYIQAKVWHLLNRGSTCSAINWPE